jgi:hypothetical protein
MRFLLIVLLIIPGFLRAQDAETEQPAEWAALQYFSGVWEGESTGKSGVGRGEREYEFILGEQYLHFKNRAVFEPQEKNPKGETHEDWGFLSYDKGRKTCILRQFNVEGYINQYVLESMSDGGDTLVFVTEGIENIPDGWRARLTYTITGDDKFTEVFDLAAPGKEFSSCVENYWTRQK